MADITSLLFVRHLRAEPTSWVMLQRNGRSRRAGQGVSFWFRPLGASIVEVPLENRELPFLFHGRTKDYQEVSVQGVVTYRIAHPELIAQRISFAIDGSTGVHTEQPLDKLALTLTQLAQQRAIDHVAQSALRALLSAPLEQMRTLIHDGLSVDNGVAELGVEVVSTRIARIAPTAELERALQMPTRETIQQTADEATFQRRALAVEKERAIAENELQNKIELARREEVLIEQEGQNAKKEASEAAEAERIRAESDAATRRVAASSEADAIESVEGARTRAEEARMDIYRELPTSALLGLAARDLAGKLEKIEHLTLSPDSFGPLLQRLATAGAKALEEPK